MKLHTTNRRLLVKCAGAAQALLLALSSSTILLAQSTPAQKSQTSSPSVGAVLLGRAPVNQETLRIKHPRGQEFVLPNGLRVVLLERHEASDLFDANDYRDGRRSFRCIRPARPFTDDRLLAARRHCAAHEQGNLRATGHARREFQQEANLQSAYAGITASGLVENLDQTLDIFADVIRHPKFPADELEKLKTRTIASQKSQRANPFVLGVDRILRAVYGDHPGGFFDAPVEAIERTTQTDLQRFHALHYKPNNSILLVMGDVTLNEVKTKIERAFGDWPRGQLPEIKIPPAPAQSSSRIHLVNRPGSEQTFLGFGGLGIEFNDSDYFALLLMNHILGGVGASRLYLNLREEKGYTYSVSSFFNLPKYRGYWFASAAVRTEVTDGAMREFMYELKRIRDEKVTLSELENARRSIIGRFALDLERPNDLLENIAYLKLFNLPANYWDTYAQKISAVTAEDVQRAAQKYIDLKRMQIVAVGDTAKIREALAKYGTVEVYETK